MDSARGFDGGNARVDQDDAAMIGVDDPNVDAGVDDAMFDLGGDERRMHVRAYNHWVSLLRGRPYPSIADLDPDNIVDFGANSALLDFSGGIDDPKIAYLGRTLREECGLDAGIARIADVPSRSLLSRLTDHYLQIIANRAPIGFEAEFVNTRGLTTLYRGILMPFSSDGDAIDFIYGVINWKEVADQSVQASLDAELAAAVRGGSGTPRETAIWADGPSGGFDTPDATVDDAADQNAFAGSLDDRLMMARESAAAVRAADTRSRAALYRALGRAHDFAIAAADLPDDYAALLARAGIVAQARAPMTPVAKLVFGADYDKTRLTEYAAVLQHAARNGVGSGGLPMFLDAFEGGVKAVVAAERAMRKPVAAMPAIIAVADRPAIAHLSLDTGATPGSVVVLVARVAADGSLDIMGSVADTALAKRALGAIG